MDAEVFHTESFEFLSELCDTNDHNEREKLMLNFISSKEQSEKVVVNEFHPELEWFNTKNNLTLERLKNKVVVLDFFTYCCINCMHILPDLEELENKFTSVDGLVVIGVHSAKFDNEKDSANILSAIVRYGINHPVVNDSEASMWSHLQINCWPTLVILGPDSIPLVALVGEGHKQTLMDFVSTAVKYYGSQNKLSNDPIELQLCKDSIPASPLLYPGKVSIREDLLAISDTGHHRIVITNSTGVVEHYIGSGSPGLKDGTFSESQFRSPQGVCWNKEGTMLYVADTENHVIREINLVTKTVSIIAGSGKQGHDHEGGNTGTDQPISSPWDITLSNSIDSEGEDLLFITMAGTHQIWMFFLEDGTWLKGKKYSKGTCVRFAGNGNEENRNNSYPHNAAFAQPSGICIGFMKIKGVDDPVKHIFIADSESSSIRSISLKDGSVRAIVGGDRDPRNLFGFGDVDGTGFEAKLQHPLGVTMRPTSEKYELIVADSYNHKIKAVDVNLKECRTISGTLNSEKQLNEPGGICMHPKQDKLFIADTNNHKIKIYEFEKDLLTELTIIEPSTQSFSTVDAKEPKCSSVKRLTNKKALHLTMDPVLVYGGDELHIEISINFADGLHLTEDAPSAFQILLKDDDIHNFLKCNTPIKQLIKDSNKPTSFYLIFPESCVKNILSFEIECLLYHCDDEGLCMVKGYVHDLEVKVLEKRSEAEESPRVVQTQSTLSIDRDKT